MSNSNSHKIQNYTQMPYLKTQQNLAVFQKDKFKKKKKI